MDEIPPLNETDLVCQPLQTEEEGLFSVNTSKVRLALLVAYNGQPYFGSQAQRHPRHERPTIHDTLLAAFQALGYSSAHHLVMVSRTDAGVHAEGLVAHVDLSWEDWQRSPAKGEISGEIRRLTLALNAKLPQTIWVRGGAIVASTFDAKRSAVARWYRYSVVMNSPRMPLVAPNVLPMYAHLTIAPMQQAAQGLLGTHDFWAFSPITQTKRVVLDTQCHLYHVGVSQPEGHQPNRLVIDVVGNRFLYKMVRRIAGGLVQVGRGRCTPEQLAAYFQPDVAKQLPPLPTLAAQGLTLMAVQYPAEVQPFPNDPWVQALETMLEGVPVPYHAV